MLKTEITFERILGTFAPGAVYICGVWYLHRPFFLKYFPNLVGGLVEKNTAAGTQFEQIGEVSVGAKLVLFVLVSFCVGIVLNQIADIGIAFLFLDNTDASKTTNKTKRFIKRGLQILTLTYFREDPRINAVANYINSGRKQYFLKIVRLWTKADANLLNEFEEDRESWTTILKNEAVVVHQHIIARLEIMSGISQKVFDEQSFSLNFMGSLMATFILLLPVAFLTFLTSTLSEGQVKVHYNLTLWLMILVIYLGVGFCGLLLKRQFKKLCQHLLTTSFHLYLIENEAIRKENTVSKQEKLIIDTSE